MVGSIEQTKNIRPAPISTEEALPKDKELSSSPQSPSSHVDRPAHTDQQKSLQRLRRREAAERAVREAAHNPPSLKETNPILKVFEAAEAISGLGKAIVKNAKDFTKYCEKTTASISAAKVLAHEEAAKKFGGRNFFKDNSWTPNLFKENSWTPIGPSIRLQSLALGAVTTGCYLSSNNNLNAVAQGVTRFGGGLIDSSQGDVQQQIAAKGQFHDHNYQNSMNEEKASREQEGTQERTNQENNSSLTKEAVKNAGDILRGRV